MWEAVKCLGEVEKYACDTITDIKIFIEAVQKIQSSDFSWGLKPCWTSSSIRNLFRFLIIRNFSFKYFPLNILKMDTGRYYQNIEYILL